MQIYRICCNNVGLALYVIELLRQGTWCICYLQNCAQALNRLLICKQCRWKHLNMWQEWICVNQVSLLFHLLTPFFTIVLFVSRSYLNLLLLSTMCFFGQKPFLMHFWKNLFIFTLMIFRQKKVNLLLFFGRVKHLPEVYFVFSCDGDEEVYFTNNLKNLQLKWGGK